MKKVIIMTVVIIITFMLTDCQIESDEVKREMTKDSISLVDDGKNKYFVSTDTGEIMSAKYEDAYLFESQNSYSRVKKDGKWGIVDSSFNEVIPFEYDYINEIPYVYTRVTGVRNGIAVIIRIMCGEESSMVEMDKYSQIGEMYNDWFCFVANENGTGIVDYNGTDLLQANYKKLSIAKWLDLDTCIISTQSWKGDYGAVLFKKGEVYEMIEPTHKNELSFD